MGGAEHNPYAPPEEPVPQIREIDRASNFEAERRPVVLLLLLGLVTLGIYQAIWLYRRRAFLDSLDTPQKIGPGLPIAIIACYVISVPLLFLGKDGESIGRTISLGGGGVMLIASFRVASILRSEFARTGRYLSVSSVWVFLFGAYYLQYKMNQAADTPPLLLRAKKKKKRKKKPVDAEGEGEAKARPAAEDAREA